MSLTACKAGIAALTLGAVLAFAAPALAIGTDSGPTVKPCAKGQIYDKKKKVCVAQSSAVMEDVDIAAYAYLLAKEGRYEEAITVLDLAKDQERADVLNYRGYATRKLGRIDEGITYYRAALKADPENVLVREYLGEAYVTQGKIDEAKALLKEIEMRCGTECEAYEDLSEAIAKGA